jgi:hypothetical protein
MALDVYDRVTAASEHTHVPAAYDSMRGRMMFKVETVFLLPGEVKMANVMLEDQAAGVLGDKAFVAIPDEGEQTGKRLAESRGLMGSNKDGSTTALIENKSNCPQTFDKEDVLLEVQLVVKTEMLSCMGVPEGLFAELDEGDRALLAAFVHEQEQSKGESPQQSFRAEALKGATGDLAHVELQKSGPLWYGLRTLMRDSVVASRDPRKMSKRRLMKWV